MTQNLKLDRRHFLRSLGASTAGLGLAQAFGGFAARAADVSGYRALVCVFLKGGMDGHDTLIPFDSASYNRYADIRAEFMNADDGLPDGPLRSRNALMELSAANASEFGSRSFALPPSLSGMHSLFEQGKASVIANVGPLLTPINATQYRENQSLRPSKLFSHNDQQSTWMALAPEGARTGWGGKFADAALAANANAAPAFTAITVSGTEVFLAGENVVQYKLGSNGIEGFREFERRSAYRRAAADDPVVEAALIEHYSKAAEATGNLYGQDVARIAQRAYAANATYQEATEALGEIATPFPDSGLARQLETVARTIAARGALGASRQVFIVTTGGYDTHSSQAANMPNLHRTLDAAISAFYSSLEEMGVENDVTTFTASDFGRTLTLNNSGTDHGWAGHQFVIGGSVDGGKIFGDVPPYDLDHEYDVGRGRMVPTTSIEQFAAPFGRWFGLNESEVRAALPNLGAFESGPTFV